jgi:hypothetical protein
MDSWYNCRLKRVVHGTIYVYKINDITSGEWTLNVKISEKEGKAIVIAPTSE